jgi:hypothetical protein
MIAVQHGPGVAGLVEWTFVLCPRIACWKFVPRRVPCSIGLRMQGPRAYREPA